MSDLLQQKQVASKFAVAAALLGDTMLAALRKEMRRLSPGLRIEVDRLKATLADHVIKRGLIDSEEGHAAQAAMRKLAKALDREREEKVAMPTAPVADEPIAPVVEASRVSSGCLFRSRSAAAEFSNPRETTMGESVVTYLGYACIAASVALLWLGWPNSDGEPARWLRSGGSIAFLFPVLLMALLVGGVMMVVGIGGSTPF